MGSHLDARVAVSRPSPSSCGIVSPLLSTAGSAMFGRPMRQLWWEGQQERRLLPALWRSFAGLEAQELLAVPASDLPKPAAPAKPSDRQGSAGLAAGVLGCVLGVLGIFTTGIVFVPLAALCSVIGLLRGLTGGSGSGFAVSFLGIVLTGVGFAVSPSLWFFAAGLFVASHVDERAAGTKHHRRLRNHCADPCATSPLHDTDASRGGFRS